MNSCELFVINTWNSRRFASEEISRSALVVQIPDISNLFDLSIPHQMDDLSYLRINEERIEKTTYWKKDFIILNIINNIATFKNADGVICTNSIVCFKI